MLVGHTGLLTIELRTIRIMRRNATKRTKQKGKTGTRRMTSNSINKDCQANTEMEIAHTESSRNEEISTEHCTGKDTKLI
ncbi:hypothetical protein BLNAU_18341 [Blattamonas nauphoetae]|uniref:Uncharacterized protein n=1 Tax=Blattamonas nauphoetae TaxID=2049346 RepID=A0ABQ9X4Q2_9EUKA|nr:hypothetical protein BLNAU_18341 [Blattamonas nauphoetae]